jgi:hypothetical protein
MALRATASIATVAAYGVARLAPLNPDDPADPQAMVLPDASAIVKSVLLKVAKT